MSDMQSTPLMNSARTWLGVGLVASILSSCWAVFQWVELVDARQGLKPFCSVNDTLNCTAVWDSPVAVALHNLTRVPVAGHGLMWGLLMTALLAALWFQVRTPSWWVGAVRITSVVGVLSVVLLAIASAMAGALCLTCLGTYALVAVAVFAAWRATSAQPASWMHGAGVAGAGAFGLWLLCLYPGLQTPHAPQTNLALPAAPNKPAATTTTPTIPAAPLPPSGPGPFDGAPTGDPTRDQLLSEFIGQLDAGTKQLISDVFGMYQTAQAQPKKALPTTRALSIGSGNEPVQLIDWTDPRCPHCRALHHTLVEIKESLPPGLFSVDSRQFPLDGACNPGVQRKSDDAFRCTAAKAAICFEGDKRVLEATGAIFDLESPTVADLMKVLAPIKAQAALTACITSPQTQKKLEDDVAAALVHDLQGTPLLLANGFEFHNFPPALYVFILTGGSMKHPALASLPAPRPPPKDDGHGHAPGEHH
jgi:uncharacterized membrane protein/protein-disulfide isomerase